MAIVYPIDWLNVGRLTALIVEQQTAVASTVSPYSYKEQTQAYQGERFSFSADIALEDEADIRGFNAWISSLRGGLGTFRVSWEDLKLATDLSLAPTPIIGTGVFMRGQRTFVIDIVDHPALTPAHIGHPFSIYANVSGVQWHTGVVSALTGGGNADIEVFPALRSDIPLGVGNAPYSMAFTQSVATPNINFLTCRLSDTPTLPIRSPYRAQVRLNFAEVIV